MSFTGILSALVVGLVVGVFGRLLAPGRDRAPVGMTVLVGVVAAFVGALLTRLLLGEGVLTLMELIVEIVLAVVGLTVVSRAYRRRDDPQDNVRAEIEQALRMKRVVLPVLVDDALMPRREELPPSLDQLHRRNAVRVHHETWESDLAALLSAVTHLRR